MTTSTLETMNQYKKEDEEEKKKTEANGKEGANERKINHKNETIERKMKENEENQKKEAWKMKAINKRKDDDIVILMIQ